MKYISVYFGVWERVYILPQWDIVVYSCMLTNICGCY